MRYAFHSHNSSESPAQRISKLLLFKHVALIYGLHWSKKASLNWRHNDHHYQAVQWQTLLYFMATCILSRVQKRIMVIIHWLPDRPSSCCRLPTQRKRSVCSKLCKGLVWLTSSSSASSIACLQRLPCSPTWNFMRGSWRTAGATPRKLTAACQRTASHHAPTARRRRMAPHTRILEVNHILKLTSFNRNGICMPPWAYFMDHECK